MSLNTELERRVAKTEDRIIDLLKLIDRVESQVIRLALRLKESSEKSEK